MARIEAVIFDLYGTLVLLREKLLHREAPRLLGVERRRWTELVRGGLLARSFADREAFARFVCGALVPGHESVAESRLLRLVERELASAEPSEGALSLLAFLRRRGYRLGLVSNLSSVHKEPIARLGLAEHFAATALSCDEGASKPEPRLYLDLCSRLGVGPGAALVVGDSLQNDVLAPRRLGMRALRVGEDGADLRRVAELGWVSLAEGSELRPLLSVGDEVLFPQGAAVLRELCPLPDQEQGRYNLVARGRVELAGGATREVFCKRFLFPEAVHVEAFAHRLHAFVGLPSCDTAVTAGSEPCLVVSRAAGRKLEGAVGPPLAYEIGRHCALAYLLANADLRPRNAFVAEEAGRPSITMVDLEHCLFNLALDVTGVADPRTPAALDALGREELRRRVQKRVLTEKTTRRARRTFFETDSLDTELARAFRLGWLDVYRKVQAEADSVLGLVEERIYTEPFLIVGTLAHRRAMARVDLEDLAARIRQDPERVFEACF